MTQLQSASKTNKDSAATEYELETYEWWEWLVDDYFQDTPTWFGELEHYIEDNFRLYNLNDLELKISIYQRAALEDFMFRMQHNEKTPNGWMLLDSMIQWFEDLQLKADGMEAAFMLMTMEEALLDFRYHAKSVEHRIVNQYGW